MIYDLKGKSPAIPIGSLVLVTGISGYIGSHVADQLLQAGYCVRGTVRDESKGEWVRELFNKKYGEGKVETVVVADMAHDGAFDEACKGWNTHRSRYPLQHLLKASGRSVWRSSRCLGLNLLT